MFRLRSNREPESRVNGRVAHAYRPRMAGADYVGYIKLSDEGLAVGRRRSVEDP